MTTETHLHEEPYEDDAFAASLSLEEELLGKGYAMAAPLGSSLAAELHSATNPPLEPLSPTPSNSKLASLAMDRSLSSPLRRANDSTSQMDLFNSNNNNNNNNIFLGSTSTNRITNNTIPTENDVHNDNTETNIDQSNNSTSSNSSTSSKHNDNTLQSSGHINNGVSMDIYTQENFSDQTSPVMSPLQWSTFGRSRRSSFSSTWSSLEPEVDDDPFEVLKRQLEELNSVVWETKTLHKRLSHTLASADERSILSSSYLQQQQQQRDGGKKTSLMDGGKPLELIMTSVATLVESKSRDRERQTNSLRNLESALRKEANWMPLDALRELEHLVGQMKVTLYDKAYLYENPLPLLRHLTMETSGMTDTLEELKELMYVNKRQVTELNQRLRSIAKTVHEVRKDIRRINKYLEEKDDDDALVLEKGEVQERVKEIMWGLDDLDVSSSRKIKQMQLFWEEQIIASVAS
ncbi:uncharacterized protein BX664DRAFT_329119 [Halteromyces radiatus]|uniref:uncharacterized protein n=1 Tax=Halteromyces radiatus TaxID=101107 RepID=UPI002220B966|nr:uncharacterized protein BX664DRAFT_329119 [Halteromyces radiatus]KAI8093190.1 hypothetical protein BX664DRAFT_329119 [Halteromyces radiatus]